jgi:hypothetical protein
MSRGSPGMSGGSPRIHAGGGALQRSGKASQRPTMRFSAGLSTELLERGFHETPCFASEHHFSHAASLHEEWALQAAEKLMFCIRA